MKDLKKRKLTEPLIKFKFLLLETCSLPFNLKEVKAVTTFMIEAHLAKLSFYNVLKTPFMTQAGFCQWTDVIFNQKLFSLLTNSSKHHICVAGRAQTTLTAWGERLIYVTELF